MIIRGRIIATSDTNDRVALVDEGELFGDSVGGDLLVDNNKV